MSEARTVIVTGASSGVGAAIASAFGGLGWRVAIGARRAEKLADTAAAVAGAGGKVFSHALDVTVPDSIDAFFAATEAALGAADVVINNAGIGVPGKIHELGVADLERELATNLLGPMLVTRRALPAMLERRAGDIVFVSSMNAVAPRPYQAGYTASKAGVEGLAHALRMDLEGTGIRTSILRLGPTFSEFGLGWDSDLLLGVIESWQRWGFMRHMGMLDATRVAEAVVAAVTAPRGVQFDVIQVNPEAPPPEEQ
jgi:NADP-dependent 3-hydroxy acid dehydrogenase YdfG